MATTIHRFYNIRHVDTYEVGDEEIDAVRALIEKGDDESLVLADDIITQHGRYVGTDEGDIDPENEMLDFDIPDEDVTGHPTQPDRTMGDLYS